jgi:phosphoribosyl 1,2-cyclic phosphodiesterase
MTVKFWGTRGSIPVAGESYARCGGNTTCVEVISDRLPSGYKLVIDAGTGIIPFGQEILRSKQAVSTIGVLFTHFHHDHTQGLLMLRQLYDKTVEIQLLGPQENGTGPKEVMEALMCPPFFPVSFAEVCSHVKCKGIEHPAGKVIVIHPQVRPTLITLEELERVDKDPTQQLRLGQRRVDIKECLIIRMYRSNHPERTISYRFEDRSIGKVFVFLTDHENTDGTPAALKRHLSGADLLVMDSQYDREQYIQYTAGFGHGTPDYCLRVANEVSAGRLLLTHHDPDRTDDGIREMQESFGPEFRTRGDDYVHFVADGETFQV